MMNIPPSEAKRLSLEEYDALLWHWNKAHSGGDDISPPDAEKTQRMLDRINSDKRFTGAKVSGPGSAMN